MFGTKKNIYTKQLKRAATIENCLKAGIFDHQMELQGFDAKVNPPDDKNLAIIAGAVNYILGWDIEKQVEMLDGSIDGINAIHALSRKILNSDSDLEKLVIRMLYDKASLGMLLKKDSTAQRYLSEHSRIMEILKPARDKYPELFQDVKEAEFKRLFSVFVNKYLPDMIEKTSGLFY